MEVKIPESNERSGAKTIVPNAVMKAAARMAAQEFLNY